MSAVLLKSGKLVLSVISQKTRLTLQVHQRDKQTRIMTSINEIVLLDNKNYTYMYFM